MMELPMKDSLGLWLKRAEAQTVSEHGDRVQINSCQSDHVVGLVSP